MAAARTSSKMLPLALVALALCGTFVAFGRCQVTSSRSTFPMKPPTLFFLFREENRARIAKNLRNLGMGHSISDVSREASKEWRALSAEQKTDIEKRSAELEATYEVELKNFFASGGMIRKRAKKARFSYSGLRQPKKPPKPFFLFMQENRDRIAKNLGTATAPLTCQGGGQGVAGALRQTEGDILKRRAGLWATYEVDLENFLASGGVRSKKAKKVKDPYAPKRPLSCYMLWWKDNRPSFVSSLPKKDQKNVGLVIKIAGERWAEASDDVKAEYKQKSDKLKVAYEKELTAYKASFE